MPTIVSSLLASCVALVLESWLRPYLGIRVTAAGSLAAWIGVFYVTRRWLVSVREGN